jgi:propionyl-CoA carboxylase alpha chain
MASQRQALQLAAGTTEHHVTYELDRWGTITDLDVDGVTVDVRAALDHVRLRPPMVVDDTVHLLGGRIAVRVVPRFRAPDEAGRAGSLVAPMPGSVLRLLVAPGDTVAAGQPMLAMEAMKMEHQVVAPLSGTVAEILVAVGQQLDTGQVLVRIDPADTEQADGS